MTLGLATSCNFLDVVPEGKATEADLFKTHVQADNFAASLYFYMPNRFGLQTSVEIAGGGDMMSSHYGGVRYFKWKSLIYNDYESPSNTYYAMWSQAGTHPSGFVSYAIWTGIRNAYMLLEHCDGVADASEAEKSRWKGEAYWIIAYMHQTLLEYYGPVILVKEMVDLNADMNEPRAPYLECVQFISDMYDKAAEYLPSTQSSSNIGRATKTLALALKSRVWMYAASPLINGNSEYYADFKNPDGTHLIPQTEDKELWKTAMDAAEAAIQQGERDGFKLYTKAAGTDDFTRGYNNYRETFLGAPGASMFYNQDEHLFSYLNRSSYNVKCWGPRYNYAGKYSAYDKNNSKDGKYQYYNQGWRGYFVPTLETVEIFLSKNGLPMDVDPETKDLNLYSIAPGDETVLLHRNREPRFYASIGYDRGEFDIDGKTITLECRYGERSQNDMKSSSEYQSCSGYYVKKWVKKEDTFNYENDEWTFTQFAYPYIRFAESYMDYVEAEVMYKGSLSAKGLSYLNKVRNRAGLPNFEDSWAKVGGMPTGQQLIDVIRQERMAEFVFEGRWWHDVRRWKMLDKYLLHSAHGWNLAGSTAEEFYKVVEIDNYLPGDTQKRTFEIPRNIWLAIPQTEININPNLVQNPGY